ncbi:DUF305 domain-containing protein [Lentzea flava]|uniref:DUF305 domain-containing protein n=1 Tax=Lentzea flava TaxID=103732 RepID=A0ABQ2UDV6_9PSEU|nr:DUF305 domain-containing protein [Lentzea flava]MCP2198414.1 Uncharacterized conserved protein, DUF305 family [Lentzea flava]GGU25743.1 hypothetical protein GCM10010178_17410 [Lentzea flava]
MLAVASVLLLSACGSPATHNSADVAFAQGMVPHHEQALEMTELVASRTENAHVIDLAARISKAQKPEIDRMNGWLKDWGAPVKAESHSSHGHSDTHGMVDLGNLAELDGTEFDRQWLSLMIQHHRGAVEMARKHLAAGTDPETRKLAQDVITLQEKEISEMESLLPQG